MNFNQFVHKTIDWVKPPGTLKMNVDSSRVSANGSACGGILRDHHGQAVKVSYCKVSSSSSIFVETRAL
ncbi:hypothetical protein L195_g008991 [Trifolium pratense]|uniref:Uncharacterized protein n=1 Tax=Trifolium pratense TaxID=57577 RepID=A0A2K3PAQ6_TRIPR|nr:hypothetical protein L195_g008991 [Trifolium pratense]